MDLDRRTIGARRRRECIRKATDVLVEMVAEAVASGIQTSHLLFDSWFAHPATMRKLLAKGVHTLCMLKITEKIFYHYQGEDLHLAAIYRKIRKRRGRAKILASIMVSIGEDDKGIPVPVKIVFVRDRRTKKWLALLSTDTSLGSEEIVTAYKRRWDIEVFFKMAKSFLNLAKECQGRSYDALVSPMPPWCAADTSCWPLPRGPTRTPGLIGFSEIYRQFTGQGGYSHGKITPLIVKEQIDRQA